jgi:hypothetical protein
LIEEKIMPKDALPPGFNNAQTGDWSKIWPFKYITPSWTAFGPRCKEWWAAWREFPVALVSLKGEGPWRSEPTDGSDNGVGETVQEALAPKVLLRDSAFVPNPGNQRYLSSIQYWAKWSVMLQWPLFFAVSYYLDPVPLFPILPGTKRVLYFRIGARRNAQGFYDFPSAYVGKSFN